MTKNATSRIPKNQVLLLKILKCLWNQYLVNQTPATTLFFASPSQANYNIMLTELDALAAVINNLVNLSSSALVLPGLTATAPLANIWSSNANGVIAFYSALENGVPADPVVPDTNDFRNFVDGSLTLNQGVMNTGSLRAVQKLNNDDSATEAYQVTPQLSTDADLAAENTFVTAATVVGRTGCPGVTNTGFVALQLEVDLPTFAFETCGPQSCVEVNCNQH